ncbi:hypothetical protein ACFL3D_01135 [Candidatus Omnitrophota bacterium]
MYKRFDKLGKLIFPVKGSVSLPKSTVSKKEGMLVVKEAYCANGHSLITDVKIDDHKGIRFIYTNQKGTKETELVISPVVKKCRKKILRGEKFEHGEIVKILCPHCRTELPVLFNCECGASVYLFYIDKTLDHNYGQSLCARIGCVKASQLRFSGDALKQFTDQYGF